MGARVSLAVVNYNSAALTARLLESVGDQLHQVIVVDGASPEPGFDALAKRFPGAEFVRLDANRGYGSAANAAAKQATGDVLVVSNPDVVIDAAGLQRLADEVVVGGAVLAAPRLVFADGSLQRSAHRREPGLWVDVFELCYPVSALGERYFPDRHPTLYSRADHDRVLEPKSVLGALMAIDLPAFRAAGGFDESFFLYREETDLCRRLREGGGRIRYVASVEAVHESGGSTPGGELTQTRPAYLDSNLRYLVKWRGRLVGIVAWVLGVVSSLVWMLTGPRRASARAVVGWHLHHWLPAQDKVVVRA